MSNSQLKKLVRVKLNTSTNLRRVGYLQEEEKLLGETGYLGTNRITLPYTNTQLTEGFLQLFKSKEWKTGQKLKQHIVIFIACVTPA